MFRAFHRAMLLGTTALFCAASPAAAQSGWFVDALLRGEGAPPPSRSVDLEQSATKRYAIVIGNGSYSSIPALRNARSDSEVMAAFLETQGYDVRHHIDVTKRDFETLLRRALFDIDKETEVVVFFAGHGFQIGSENYLVPVDADLESAYDVPFEAVSLGSLVSIIGARARLQVIILDSCRDNPFAGRTAFPSVGKDLRETRTGFSSLAAPLNSMLVYSTSPGAVAYDGEGGNSPFTAALVEEASADPVQPVKSLFETVRRRVFQATEGRQVPWDSSTLVEPMSFGQSMAEANAVELDGAPGTRTRGLARIIPASAVAASGQALQPPPEAAIELPFEGDVGIGAALREALGIDGSDEVEITLAPRTGRLVLDSGDPIRPNAPGKALRGADLNDLVLINESVQVPARTLDGPRITDRIGIRVNGTDRAVALSLLANACDFEAGDHLDPDGMGITRYPNELRPELALEACDAAIRMDPEVGRFHYQKGRALTALKRDTAAREAYLRARDLGHSRAWNALGTWLVNDARRTGGGDRASSEALQLFARGVKEGDPYAFYSLGRQFLRYGDSPDIEVEGYDLMMRALEVGHTFAMNELGSFYLDEDSEYQDPKRGLRYFRESAARRDIFGYNNLALVYLQGLGDTQVDHAAALELFLDAAQGGHPNAPSNLGYMYREGFAEGGPAEAVKWYAEGLERGDARAGGEAAFLISSRGAPGYDMTDAAVLAAKAAALVNHDASEQARGLLGTYTAQAINAAAQTFIAALGTDISVDGAFGAGSLRAYEEVLARFDAGVPFSDPVDRAVQLAAILWTQSPFRVDLY